MAGRQPIHVLRRWVVALLTLVWFVPASASAEPPGLGPDVPPPPPPMTILVVGDSIAHDLGVALTRSLATQPGITVVNRGRAITGLVRDDYYDWPGALATILADTRADAAVVSIGMNDRQAITENGVILARFSDDWRNRYADRASAMMTQLEQAGIPTFWMGMPTARNRTFSRDMAFINQVFEETASRHPGVTYVSMWDLTADAAGNYQAYGPDAAGRPQPLRAADGMHFSVHGIRLVVGHLVSVMNRVLGVSLAAS